MVTSSPNCPIRGSVPAVAHEFSTTIRLNSSTSMSYAPREKDPPTEYAGAPMAMHTGIESPTRPSGE
eukprot:scaffold273_cov242-Pinguiococcus_pyrenoidosus.AAC.23